MNSEPTTEAGRRVERWLLSVGFEEGESHEAIAAIEAQARAQVEAEYDAAEREMDQSEVQAAMRRWFAEHGVNAQARADAEATIQRLRDRLQRIANVAHLAWTDPPSVREAFEAIEREALADTAPEGER